MPHDYMGPALALNKKSALCKSADNLFARDAREPGHTETSTSLSSTATSDSGIGSLSSLSDQRYNSIASLILANTSSIVSPWEAQPGNAGTWTEYPPSASGSIITLNRFSILTPSDTKDTAYSDISQGKNLSSNLILAVLIGLGILGLVGEGGSLGRGA